MKAIVYEAFRAPLQLESVPDPAPEPHGVVVEMKASGICRSDWHGWMGHDADVELPHVPGHELAGVISAVGKEVTKWRVGDRVTVPFVGGCGACGQCRSGNQQVCDRQFQPGFTHWGSFAQFVSLHYADTNLVALPAEMEFATAASLGCRFVTSFRAVVDQGRVGPGQWIAVHGCGGVGLSAIMIANAVGANVIAVDIAVDKLDLAKSLGAAVAVNGASSPDVVAEIIEITGGGAHVSIDALGHPTTCFNSVANLRTRGRHVQIGLMLPDQSKPAIPMAKVIAKELEIVGSHGMQAHRYDELFAMIQSGKLSPDKLITQKLGLEGARSALQSMEKSDLPGIAVITDFG